MIYGKYVTVLFCVQLAGDDSMASILRHWSIPLTYDCFLFHLQRLTFREMCQMIVYKMFYRLSLVQDQNMRSQ